MITPLSGTRWASEKKAQGKHVNYFGINHMTTKPRTLHEMEQFVIDQFKAHWFTQGGTARFGAIDGTNADELVASILAALLEAVPHLDDHEKNDHGGTRLTAVAAVSVSEADQLTHAMNDKLIALYDAIARTAGVTREIAVAETGYFVHALVQAIINQAGSVSVVEGDSDRPQRAGAQAPKSNSSNCPATPEGSRDES